jgi:hypothetical protein
MSSGIDGGQLDLSGVRWLPGGARLAAVAQAELPQKDGLAAAFTALAALRAAGIEVTDQDEVAAAAGTIRGPAVHPAGAAGRADFRLRLPQVGDPAAAGTRVAALADAVSSLSRGALAAVPVTGEWTAEALLDLLVGLWDLPRVAVIAHVDAAEFGAQDTPERALLDYLDTGIPPLWTSRWRPPGGHFVLVAGVRLGAEGTLLSIVDTYPSLGDNGIHCQPAEWVTAGLHGLGLLIVVDTPEVPMVHDAVGNAELAASFWD